MHRLLLVTAILAFTHGSRLPPMAEPHLIGGTKINIDEAPYTASVVVRRNHKCGGVILSPTKVLTTATCVTSADSKLYDWLNVRVGSTSHLKGGQDIETARVDKHPKYRKTAALMDYDIAIITLKTPILLGERLKTRSVVLAPKPPVTSEEITVTGFGWRKVGKDKDEYLESMKVRVTDRETCTSTIKEQIPNLNVSDTIFCAGAYRKNIYKYDFGSPAVNHKQELVGIAVSSNNYRLFDSPGVYINVSSPAIHAFINEHVKF